MIFGPDQCCTCLGHAALLGRVEPSSAAHLCAHSTGFYLMSSGSSNTSAAKLLCSTNKALSYECNEKKGRTTKQTREEQLWKSLSQFCKKVQSSCRPLRTAHMFPRALSPNSQSQYSSSGKDAFDCIYIAWGCCPLFTRSSCLRTGNDWLQRSCRLSLCTLTSCSSPPPLRL